MILWTSCTRLKCKVPILQLKIQIKSYYDDTFRWLYLPARNDKKYRAIKHWFNFPAVIPTPKINRVSQWPCSILILRYCFISTTRWYILVNITWVFWLYGLEYHGLSTVRGDTRRLQPTFTRTFIYNDVDTGVTNLRNLPIDTEN